MSVRIAVFALLIGALAAGCIGAGHLAAARTERLMGLKLDAALDALLLDWAEIAIDGMRVRLSGAPPDGHAAELALETMRRAAPLARITDATTRPDAPAPQRRPAKLEIHRDGGELRLLGHLPSIDARQALGRVLARRAPDLVTQDLTLTGAAIPEAAFDLALAAEAVLRVSRGFARLDPGRLRVVGMARSEAERSALMRHLVESAPDGLLLEIDLDVPPPVIAPFAFAAVMKPGAGLRLEQCAARDASEAAAIQAALRAHGLARDAARCPVGLGGPPGDWPQAIGAGLAALSELGGGRFRLDYRLAWLSLPPGVGDDHPAVAGLAAALPAGTDLTIAAEATVGDAEAGDAAPEPRPPWLSLSSEPERVVLAGLVADLAAAEALATLARVRLPGRTLHLALSPAEAPPPADWSAAASAALDALSELARGRARLSPDRVLFEGEVADPAAARRLHSALVAALPGREIRSDLSYDLPARIAALPITPARCVHLLNRLVGGRALVFAPGSAVLDASAGPLLDEAARLLRRCPGARIEIGGHTDSQGSAGFNQRLSRSRAETVRAGLVERGLALGSLGATGYGETEPIASNATEPGRALNRRIAFRLMSELEAQAGTGARAEADP